MLRWFAIDWSESPTIDNAEYALKEMERTLSRFVDVRIKEAYTRHGSILINGSFIETRQLVIIADVEYA